MNNSEVLAVSRFRTLKREADRDAGWMKRNGGKKVTVIGKRGGPWRVRAQMPLAQFAKFCVIEAMREASRG